MANLRYITYSYITADTKLDIVKLFSTRPQYLRNVQNFLIDQNIYTCTLHSVMP